MQLSIALRIQLVAALIAAGSATASMIVGYDIRQDTGGYTSLTPIPGGAPEVSATALSATTPPLVNHTIPNHFRFDGWLPIVSASRYMTTTLTVDPGKLLDLSDLTYSVEDLPHTGARSTFHVRTSLDGFTNDVDAFTLTMAGLVTDRTTDLSGLAPVSGAIEFRFYATTATGGITMGFANHLPGGSGGGLPDVGQNIRFNGEIIDVPEPASIALLGLAAIAMASRRRRPQGSES